MIFALVARLRPAPPLRASQHVLFGWAGALLVAGDAVFWLMFAAIQSDSGLAAMDGPAHSLMLESRNPAATAFLAGLTIVTAPEILTVIGAVFALAWAVWKRELWRPAVLMGAMVLAVVVTTLIKQLVSRSRPPSADFLLGPDDALSFPSGHTVGIGVFTVVLAYLVLSRSGTRTTAVLGFSAALALTALVGLSRLYLGYHWLTDVVASLGVALAVAAVAMFTDAARHGSAKSRSGTLSGRAPNSSQDADPSAPDALP
ncbi:phosphatase PAP2 family protein [Arthrobacter globiformis]|uniref:phosphatase PAP2 family protein n=1 Tax=Arthrobacter globiformis TaxID=1665 RepID=UPI002790C89F|nr:phosphatase PAP2 family protein [Arthrobacter globiformis]MDQ0618909.1 membrane-associated phospholipid phosphatase [Arthrobacter globiformis]